MVVTRRMALGGALALGLTGRARADDTILLRDLYNKDLSFSDLARALAGARIRVDGFMAPPLRADSNFFVLTRRPMAVCPFCDTEADWPDDIIAVYAKRVVAVAPYNVPIIVTGRLDLGSYRDEDTGFLSRVRLTDASYERRG